MLIRSLKVAARASFKTALLTVCMCALNFFAERLANETAQLFEL
jgi:hypothetical protein